MIGRRFIIGIALLCALMFSALAAQVSLAANATTAFTCAKASPAGSGEWKDAHCTEEDATKKSEFTHTQIKPGTKTSITASNHNTANKTTESTMAVLHTTTAGVTVTFTCPEVHAEGSLTNNTGPPVSVSGNFTAKLTKCTTSGVLKEKDASCKLKSEELIVTATFTTPAESMEVRLEQEGANPFAQFTIEGCKVLTSANKSYQLTGSFTAIPHGATLETTESSTRGKGVESEKNGLWLSGQAAWFESQTTLTMSTAEPGIAFTTTAS